MKMYSGFLRKSIALVLALLMLPGIVISANDLNGGYYAAEVGDNLTVDTNINDVDGLDRSELENIVNVLDPDINVDKLTDKQLTDLANGLLESLDKDKEIGSSVNVNENSEFYDENGAMTKPFDEIYPELIEDGSVKFADESLLIKLNNSANGIVTAELKAAGVVKLESIVPLEKATWYKASLVEGTDVKKALEDVRKIKSVLIAEYDYQIETAQIDCYKDIDDKFGFENNEHKKDQWYMHHCGIPDGFNYMKYDGGQPNVIVAVIDTGVDIDHEDLEHNIWKNTKEKPDNGIDDDGNGYIDDYYGVNIVSGKGNGDDDNGHGTHVAGIIAARNNNIGTVGIAYKTTIMPIKAAMASGSLNQSDVAKAILYAYENGAEVINMSFGGSACSIAVQDALATAYTRCVLVASAGNDGVPNEHPKHDSVPNYPAALTYVLGVMAVDKDGRETYFTNWDYQLFNGVEYELYAPGYDIMSTLPDDRYGSLSGTSMAAPMVSAIAAILRSEYSDRDKYPTKFIYGQLTSTSEHYATCYNPAAHGKHNLPQIVDLYSALSKLPKPDVGMQDYLLFDTEGLEEDTAKKNNGDGVIDAGETIALGITLRNRWGMSKNTKVTIDTKSNAGISDPYITIVNPTVNYDAVGTYSTQDCGKVYTDELHTGWKNPFIIKIADDCPNDYVFRINVYLEYENGVDDADNTVYNNALEPISFTLAVRNGIVISGYISEDQTWTSDNLYIIQNTTVIEEGVTVKVRPGTRIQFFTNDAKDPYADSYCPSLRVDGKFLVEGTKNDKVYIYPSELMSQYAIYITLGNKGYSSVKYADISNLFGNYSNAISYVDHCIFRFNYNTGLRMRSVSSSGYVSDSGLSSTSNFASLNYASNCIFYKLASDYTSFSYNPQNVQFSHLTDSCIFVDCKLSFGGSSSSNITPSFTNCVFLGNAGISNKGEYTGGNSVYLFKDLSELTSDDSISVYYNAETGTTYVVLDNSKEINEQYLDDLGLEYAAFETREELEWFSNNVMIFGGKNYYITNIQYNRDNDCYVWADGSAIGDIFDEKINFLPNRLLSLERVSKGVILSAYWRSDFNVYPNRYHTVFEIKGKVLPSAITFSEYEFDIDLKSKYQLEPISEPVQLLKSDFIYESKDTSVVKVDDSGLVTPVGKGTTDVYVYSEDKAVYNYVTFNVFDYVALEDFSFAAEKDVVAIGETISTKVSFTPADTTRKDVKYKSSDEGVIKVDKDGNLTGIASGNATITATCEGISKQIIVRSYLKATSLKFESVATTLSLIDGASLLPTVITNNGAETELEWRSVDTDIVIVDDGKIVPKQLGSTTIHVIDKLSGLEADCFVAVNNTYSAPVKKILAAGNFHYVLLEDGGFYYWYKSSGKNYKVPTKIFSDVQDFSTDETYTHDICILFKDGRIHDYDLTNNKHFNSPIIEHNYFVGRNDILRIITGDEGQYYVITSSGNVFSWGGGNEYGQLGVGVIGSVSEPALVNLDNVVDIFGSTSTVFLTSDGDLYRAGSSNCIATPELIATEISDIYSNYLFKKINGQIVRLSMADGSLITEYKSDIVFDTLSYGSSINTPSNIYGASIGIKDGIPYAITGYSTTTNKLITSVIEGINNAVYAFTYRSTHYIATSDGNIFGYGYNDLEYNDFAGAINTTKVLTPVLINLNKTVEKACVVSQKRENNNYIISFNKSIEQISANLYADGEQVTVQNKIDNLNDYVIWRTNGFDEGVEYSLVIKPGSVICAGGITNDEEITVNFTFDNSLEIPEDTDDPELNIKEPVIHESVTDPSVERILTPEKFYSRYCEVHSKYNYNLHTYGNVILNRISTVTNTNYWLKFVAPAVEHYTLPFGGNYWGTTNETAISYMIRDNEDSVTMSRIDYSKYLTEAPEDTFPFVTSVKIFNKYKEEVTVVGNEQITVRVTFNRDMDTSIPLQVRFGSAYPYGDYEIEGKYVDARTWEGKYKLTTVIENGIQYFTIENGCSATDDLELMCDRARFSFVIDTTAAQALLMQGEATDTGIKLTWTQDDFDTLMGYNVYRSTTKDGLYTRINSSVVPADTMEFFDSTVEPGVLYYYNFTVVQTDLSESIPSGKIVIMSKDTMAPDIYHSPVYNATTGSNLIISATVTDNLTIAYARVYYRVKGTENWNVVVMNNLNDKYSAIIIADHITTAGLEYYIEAFDGVSYTYKGSADAPYTVAVQESVDSNAMGDINGDGKISNLDALMLLKATNDQLNLTAEQFARADLNADGSLSAMEALRILQYVSGKVGSVDMRG